MEPMHGMHGMLEAELEVRCTIKRAELTPFLCLLKKVIGPTNVQVDNERIIDGLWIGGMKCTGAEAGVADLWLKFLGRIALSAFKRNIDRG